MFCFPPHHKSYCGLLDLVIVTQSGQFCLGDKHTNQCQSKEGKEQRIRQWDRISRKTQVLRDTEDLS